MLNFNMQLKQNYAFFFDESNDKCVIVDTFDNQEFDVRVGTLTDTRHVATVHAESDEELNQKIQQETAAYL